jgi:hypothetical protein
MMSLLKRRNSLLIDPIDGEPLIRALGGRWFYPQDRFGKVSRDLPKKPNHPHEDIGDAFLALLSRIAPGADDDEYGDNIKVVSNMQHGL